MTDQGCDQVQLEYLSTKYQVRSLVPSTIQVPSTVFSKVLESKYQVHWTKYQVQVPSTFLQWENTIIKIGKGIRVQ